MQYDLVIIGSGPAGYAGAVRAAKYGLKTAIIEKETNLGGVCLNWGCIPTKTLLKTANVLTTIYEAEKYGVQTKGVSFDFSKIINRKNKVVTRVVEGVRYLMRSHNIDVIPGQACLMDKNTVKTPRGEISAKNILIATGSSPACPPIPGLDLPNVLTSRTILDVEECPKELVVIGAGVIGVEFASLFCALGTQVTVVEMLDDILPLFDPDVVSLLKHKMQKAGVTFHLSSRVTGIDPQGVFFFDAIGRDHHVKAEKVLISVGRRPNITDLGLDSVGVCIENSAILTDEKMRTNIPGIYAAGDVNGFLMLAHKASREAEAAVDTIAGKDVHLRYDAIPACVYTNPEIAAVGLTEKDLSGKGMDYAVGRYDLIANGRFLGETEGERGLIKALVGKKDGELLGLHIISPYASEIIAVGAQGIELEMLVRDFDETVFPHPTICEAVRMAIRKAI